MYLVSLHGQARRAGPASGSPTVCTAGTKSVLPSSSQRRRAHPGHDPHLDHDIRRVGELDAELGDRRAERAHRERHHVHGAAAHRPGEQLREARPASAPGRASCSSARRPPPSGADERAVLDPGHVAGRSGPETVRPQLRVQREKVPASTSRDVSRSHSSAEPSHHSTRSGWVSSAISSTQSDQAAVCSRGLISPGIASLTEFPSLLAGTRSASTSGLTETPNLSLQDARLGG